MEQSFACDVCDIKCSGIEPYTQHMNSSKHRKKVEQRKLLDTTFNNEKNFYCTICEVACSGIVPYQQHKMSDKHLKKELAKKFSEKYQLSSSSDTPFLMDCDEKGSSSILNSLCSEEDECNVSSSEVVNQRGSYTTLCGQNNFKCLDCDKQFNGSVPYEQHMNSITHKKKLLQIERLSALESGKSGMPKNGIMVGKQAYSSTSVSDTDDFDNLGTVHIETLFRCSLCEKDFPSQEICDLHTLSCTHQNKQKAFPSTNGFFCAVCNKTCTGAIPYRQHMISSVHEKNVKRSKLFANVSGGKFSESNMNSGDTKIVTENTLRKSVENSSLSVLALSNMHNIGEADNNSVLAECHVCKLKFYSDEEIREHYDSDSHHDNQNIYDYKRKVRVFGPEDPFDLTA